MNNFAHVPCDCNNCIHRDAVLKRLKEFTKEYKGSKEGIGDLLLQILNGPPEETNRTDEDRGLGMDY